MGVPPDYLLRDTPDYIADIEFFFIAGYLGMKHNLQQQIAEFLAQFPVAAGIQPSGARSLAMIETKVSNLSRFSGTVTAAS
jgi:hypothetical protein